MEQAILVEANEFVMSGIEKASGAHGINIDVSQYIQPSLQSISLRYA